MNLNFSKDKINNLVLLQALLFLVFLLITFFFNRFAVDDYYFIGEVNSKSFTQIYNDLYFKWHGRWTSNFLLAFFIQFYKVPFFLMLYNIVTVGLIYLGITKLLKSINNCYTLNFTKKSILTYSIVSLSVLFFCTISANDTWVWYTSSIVYLWSTMAFIYGLSIFFLKKVNWLNYIVLGVSVIYIGGSNEPLTLLIILSLLFLLLKKKKKTISIVGLVLISTSFSINYFSPGTLNRDTITPNLAFIDLILYTGYSCVKFFFFSIHKTFIPALFIAFPFYLLGKKVDNTLTLFNPIKELIYSTLIIIGTVVFNQLIVVYALGGLSPDRSSIASSILIAILIIRYLFLLGNHHKEKYNKLGLVVSLNIVGLVIFNLYHAKVHYQYAQSIDERIEHILHTKSDPIKVKPLPESGYIYSAEITTDVGNYKNMHLKKGLGIDKDIILSTDH